MDATFNFPMPADDRTVYVRPVGRDELPSELREQVPAGKSVYAIHRSDGECLALAKDRTIAFALARTNEMAPVSVH